MMFALATSLHILIIARVLQGVATAIVFSVGFALVFDKVGSKQIGQAMGWTSMSLSLGIFLAPVVGGVIYNFSNYFMVFVPAFALIGIEIFLRSLMIEDDRRPEAKPLMDGEVTESEYGTIKSGPAVLTGECSPPLTEDTLSEDTLEPAACADQEQGASAGPTTRSSILVLMQSPRVLIAIGTLAILNSFATAFEGVLPVYVRELFGFNPMQAALLFLATGVPMLLSPLVGTLVDRIGPKWPAAAGFCFAVPGFILLRLADHNAKSVIIRLIILLCELGCSFALSWGPIYTEISLAVETIEIYNPGVFGPDGAHAQVYGLTNAAFSIGTIIGPVYAGWLRVSLGWPTMSLVMAILSLIASVSVVLGFGTK